MNFMSRLVRLSLYLCCLMACNTYAAGCFITLTEVDFGTVRIAQLQADSWHSPSYPVDLIIDCRSDAAESAGGVSLTSLGQTLNGRGITVSAFTPELRLRSSWQGISEGTPLTNSSAWISALKTGLSDEQYLIIPLLFRLSYKSDIRVSRDALFDLVGPVNGQLQWLLGTESGQHLVSFSYRGILTNGSCRVEDQIVDFGNISATDIKNGNIKKDIDLKIYCDGASIPYAVKFHSNQGINRFESQSATDRGLAIVLKSGDAKLPDSNEVISNNEMLPFSNEAVGLYGSAISVPIEISLQALSSAGEISGGGFEVPITIEFVY